MGSSASKPVYKRTFYVIVEGETLKEGNLKEFEQWRRQGWDDNDTPLSSEGKKQVDSLKLRLPKPYKFRNPTLYSGHVLSQLYTAKLVAEHCNIKINVEPQLAQGDEEDIVETQDTFEVTPGDMQLPPVNLSRKPLESFSANRHPSQALSMQRKHSQNVNFAKHINNNYQPAQGAFPSFVPPSGDIIIVTSKQLALTLIRQLTGMFATTIESASVFRIESSVCCDSISGGSGAAENGGAKNSGVYE